MENENCTVPTPEVTPEKPVYTAPVYEAPAAPVCPPENSPLSPWTYFGLQLLFSVPVVGFIFLIIFSCKSDNINRRNFARSYWCSWIIVAVILVIVLILAAIMGVGMSTIVDH